MADEEGWEEREVKGWERERELASELGLDEVLTGEEADSGEVDDVCGDVEAEADTELSGTFEEPPIVWWKEHCLRRTGTVDDTKG